MTSLRISLASLLLFGCSGNAIDAAPNDGDAASVESGSTSDGETVDSGQLDGGQVDAAPVETGAAALNAPGKHLHKETFGGLAREFIVYVPQKARDKRVPIVFMLHGTSGDGEKFFQISRWREKADAEGFIAVFPSALTHCLHEDENRDGDFVDPGEQHVTTKWASGNLGDPTRMPLCTEAELAALAPEARAQADHPLADDIAFFKGMLETLGKSYTTDAKRVYVTGFSNGAQMSSRLAVEMSDRFAAAAAHAGPMAVEPKPPARPITVVFSVGNADDRFTPVGSPIPLSESTAATPLFTRIATDYLAAGQLSNVYAFDQPRTGLARWTYSTSTAGGSNRFTVVLIENCTHEYPNGTNHPFVMADALWEMFKTQSLP